MWINKQHSIPEASTPMEIKRFLVWHRGYHKLGWRTEYAWHIEGSPSDFSDEIQFWMPLPAPPTADNVEGANLQPLTHATENGEAPLPAGA